MRTSGAFRQTGVGPRRQGVERGGGGPNPPWGGGGRAPFPQCKRISGTKHRKNFHRGIVGQGGGVTRLKKVRKISALRNVSDLKWQDK